MSEETTGKPSVVEDKCGTPGSVYLENGTSWSDPASDRYHDLSWRLRHAHDTITQADAHSIASAMDAYSYLILHPAMTLQKVQKQVSMIRRAIKPNAKNESFERSKI